MECGLKVGSWGLAVDTIGSNTSSPTLVSFTSPVAIGTASSNQTLYVNGTMFAKKSLTVYENLIVDTIVPLLANEVTVPGDLAVDGKLLVDTITTSYANEISINDKVAITGDLSVSGLVNFASFLAPKPWIGFRVMTDGAGGVQIYNHVGHNTTGISIAHSHLGLYQITIPAHPSGANYLPMFSSFSNTSSASSTFITGYAQTSTLIFVYCRSGIGATTTVNGNFHVYTVP